MLQLPHLSCCETGEQLPQALLSIEAQQPCMKVWELPEELVPGLLYTTRDGQTREGQCMWWVRVFWGTQWREWSNLQHQETQVTQRGGYKPYVGNPPPTPIGSPPQPQPHPTPNMASACSPMRSRFMLAAVGNRSDRERWGSQKLTRRMPKPAPDALAAPPPGLAFVRAQSFQAESSRAGSSVAQEARPAPGGM